MRRDSLGLFWRDEPVVRVTKPPPPKRTPPPRTWETSGYLPHLEEARAFNVTLMTDAELVAAGEKSWLGGKRHRFIFDSEVYPNYTCIAFRCAETGKVVLFEQSAQFGLSWDNLLGKLKFILEHFTIIGYNSLNFDAGVLAMSLYGCTTQQIQDYTTRNIMGGEYPGVILRSYKVPKLEHQCKVDHIDLMETAPGVRITLKVYGSRLGVKYMQDLPFPPGVALTWDQLVITRWYCVNDLDQTWLLYRSLDKELELREALSVEHSMDLRSKSDAQIAEATIGQELERLNGRRCRVPNIAPNTTFRFNVPPFLKFRSPTMQWVLQRVIDTDFVIGEDGKVIKPESLNDLKVEIGSTVYTMGIGGLHSTEKKRSLFADANYDLFDIDAESFYPKIITTLGLYPSHLGPAFLRTFSRIIDTRLDAKHAKNKRVSDSLKIVINGTYGKLGSEYSIFYAPDLLIQVTLTGQLSLMMLVERLEMAGISVVSGNTDGIMVRCPKQLRDIKDTIVAQWEKDVSFKTEEVPYKAVYSANVNNYIAVKTSGEIKSIGWFRGTSNKKSPATEVCVNAVIDFLTKGVPIRKTISECQDVSKFVRVQQVVGGACVTNDDGTYDYLGKTVRWYYSKNPAGEFVSAKSGNKVARTDGAAPLMVLPDSVPEDIDIDWYEGEARKLIEGVGLVM